MVPSITTMKAKQAILLGIFFVVTVGGMWFVANAQSRQAISQAEQARAAAVHARQEQQRVTRENQQQGK